MTRSADREAAKARAETVFKRQQLVEPADENRRAIEAAKVAEAEKTAKLRELRLAKELSDKIAAETGQERPQQ